MDAGALTAIDGLARELALFACAGFLIGGIDDLIVDLLYLLRDRQTRRTIRPARPLRYAILVPAWDEAAVIGAMLERTLARLEHPSFRMYVGCYLNDRPTITAVARLAARDPRVRLVFNPCAGPTTKGDNLNSLWRALQRDEAAGEPAVDAIVLHDAEDVVHPAELSAFDGLLGDHGIVQLPVVPLIAPNSRWVSAHYADEFAEVHPRGLAVRQRLGTGLPLAGVGCAVRRDTLDVLAAQRGGDPFSADSLVEDYELGLVLSAAGARGCFAQVSDSSGDPICVRAFFPTTVDAAVRQKARWMAGIALLGWDRLGWSRTAHVADHWMRLRDRRALLAVLVLAAAYLALAAGALSVALHLAARIPPPATPPVLATLLAINSALLVWRMIIRGWATGRLYGWREGVRAMPRMLVANFIALLAARRAFAAYAASLRGRPTRWDKTSHIYPALP